MCICRKWWAINGSLNPLLQLTGVTCMKCLSHQSSPCNLFPISFCKEGYKYLSKHSRGKKKKKQNRGEEAQKELQEGWRNEDVTYTGRSAKDLPDCTCPERESKNLKQQQKEVTWGRWKETRKLGAHEGEKGWVHREKESKCYQKSLCFCSEIWWHSVRAGGEFCN